ncbi:hypothetical protein [Paucidesulfovibrio longus]|uniref:hypothetical protein n=1 Tax=Paucidesulfovibrio longus TaxID=889 RepID=UPI0003B3526C|nr:hypothetical protein [Paucidesulfovibrio longus]
MRKIILTAACMAALALFAGCTMEKGGTEDPAGFTTVQGLEQPGEPASGQTAQPAPDPALQNRLDALETENARLQARLDELERQMDERVAAVDERLAALEAKAGEAASAATKPLVDLGNDEQFKEKVVRQGLEEILNMSRLLLDKMEYEMNQKIKDGAAPEADAAAVAGQGAAQGAAQ